MASLQPIGKARARLTEDPSERVPAGIEKALMGWFYPLISIMHGFGSERADYAYIFISI